MKSPPRRGVVLILVLIVIALLTLAGLAFAELMMAERKAAHLSGQQVQARALAESGVEMARHFLGQERQLQEEQGGCYDNPERFRALLVVADDLPREQGRVTLVAPRLEDQGPIGLRYGLEDESTRINLATLLKLFPDNAREVLMNLPGMTESTADAILDWIDEDETPREFGAEAEHYGALVPSYQARNAAPATIEELLLVRGVTPQLLLGLNAATVAQNVLGDSEGGTPQVAIPEDGSMDQGWAAYLTLHSSEQSTRADGTAKINLNQDDMTALFEELQQDFSPEEATFIVAYRQNGPASSSTSPKPGSKSTGPSELDLTKEAGTELKSILDLIGAQTKTNKDDTVTLPSPFSSDTAAMSSYLPRLMEATTVSEEPIAGRININQAPRVVLEAVVGAALGSTSGSSGSQNAGTGGQNGDAGGQSGSGDSQNGNNDNENDGNASQIVDQILSKRTPEGMAANPDHQYETWLLSEGVVDLPTMKKLMPYVTARGSVYRVQAVGFFDGGGPTARVEVVLDAGKQPAAVLFWKELTHLGRAYSQEILTGETP